MKRLFFILLSIILSITGAFLSKLPVAAEGNAAKYNITLQFNPPVPIVGNNNVTIKITDLNGNPASGAGVKVRTDMPGMNMGVRPWHAHELGAGTYKTDIEFTMIGLWKLRVSVDGKYGKEEAVFHKEVKEDKNIFSSKFWPLIIGLCAVIGGIAGWRFLGLGLIPPLLIAAVILGGGWLCTRFLPSPPKDAMGMKMDMNAPDMGMPIHLLNAPRPVAVEEVKIEDISQDIIYTGTVLADAEEIIYPRVMGWLISMPFYPGDTISPGQVVGKLDSTELSYKTDAVKQEILAQEHDLIVAKEREKEASSMLNKAKAELKYWENEFPRAEKLYSQGAISKEEYDREMSSFEAAKAEVLSKEQNLQANTHALLHHRSMINKAKSGYKEMQTVENYTTLTSRLGGVVTERMLNEGVLVSPGMGILKVSDLRHIRIQANISEQDLAKVKVGTPVSFKSAKFHGKTFSANVTSVFYATDPASRTARVEARVPNLGKKLFPGDFVEVVFSISKSLKTVTVSSSSVISYKGGSIVWVIEDGLAKRRTIVTGISNGTRTEIIKGVNVGDKVIYAGHVELKEDDPVKEAVWGSGSYKEILFPEEDMEEE